LKIKGSIAQKLSDLIASEVSDILDSTNQKLKNGLRNLAESTLAKADQMASMRLNSTRQQYVDSLKLEKIGKDVYSIYLEDDAKHLETGYDSYNMIQAGLARGPKSKVSSRGYRYVVIPFQNRKNAPPNTPSGDRQIQHVQNVKERGWSASSPNNQGVAPAKGVHSGTSLGDAIKELEKKSGLSKNIPGVTGKVGTWTSHPANNKKAVFIDQNGKQDVIDLERPFNPLLDGLMKFQNKVGKRTVGSFVTYRVASENPESKGKWVHPGFQGAKIFPELENWAMDQLQKLMDET